MSELARERKIIENNATGPYREGIISVATSDAFIAGFRSIRDMARGSTEEERKDAFKSLQKALLTSETVMNLALPFGPGLIEAEDRDLDLARETDAELEFELEREFGEAVSTFQASRAQIAGNVVQLHAVDPQADIIDRALEG